MTSNHSPLSKDVDIISSYNSCNESSDTTNLILKDRRLSGFILQEDATANEGPTGAPLLETSTIVEAAGRGPAAWDVASHCQRDDRKVTLTLTKRGGMIFLFFIKIV